MKILNIVVGFLLFLPAMGAYASQFIKDGIIGETLEKNRRVSVVEVISLGYGNTEKTAVQDAINEALKKVNGISLDINSSDSSSEGNINIETNVESSSTNSYISTEANINTHVQVNQSLKNSKSNRVYNSDENSYISTSSQSRTINEKTSGDIKTYETIHIAFLNNTYKAQVRAFIYKPVMEEFADSRIRIAVMPFRIKTVRDNNIYDFAKSISSYLPTTLNSSGKFIVLDREYSDELSKEQNNMASTLPILEITAMGEKLALDYIIVGTVEDYSVQINERQLVTVNKTIFTNIQTAFIKFNMIDIGTGAIKTADSVTVEMVSNGNTPDIEAFTKETSRLLSAKIIAPLFQIFVENSENGNVFIGLGGDIVKKGDKYKAYKLGSPIIDSVTGKKLGYSEKEMAIIEITEVMPNISKGNIVLGKPFETNGKEYIVRLHEQANSEKVTPIEPVTQPKKVKINDSDW